jgi:hypothetical protein
MQNCAPRLRSFGGYLLEAAIRERPHNGMGRPAMLHTVVLCCGLLGITPIVSRDASPGNRAEYASATTQTKLDAAGHVRLALWCESHGLTSERKEHLEQAAAADPSQPAAHGLLGLVPYRGAWLRAEAMGERAQADETRPDLLAEYNAKRAALPNTADAHWKLALWCEEQGLSAEATAHLTAVTRLAPDRAAAWHRLGCRKYEGRWMNEKQILAEKAKTDEKKRADEYWRPLFREWWKAQLTQRDRASNVNLGELRRVDARAVPTILSFFGGADPHQQAVAVQLLSSIDAPESSRGLARLAAVSRSPEVYDAAATSLVRRDPRDFVDPLIGLLRDPIRYEFHRVREPGWRGQILIVEGKPYHDVGAILRQNNVIQSTNIRVASLLEAVTDEDFGTDREAWRSWWTDKKGYTYEPPKPTRKRRYVFGYVVPVPVKHSCFAAGTPVHTLSGCRPIETLQVGDRVLTQDPTTGALDFAGVVAAYHNAPAPTLRINLGSETIIATGIHRFWRAGKGWAMARDLNAGNSIRVLGGVATVMAVEPERTQPVFNLEVGDTHSFFVGQSGALVHDYSLVDNVAVPFDRAPTSLAELAVGQEEAEAAPISGGPVTTSGTLRAAHNP